MDAVEAESAERSARAAIMFGFGRLKDVERAASSARRRVVGLQKSFARNQKSQTPNHSTAQRVVAVVVVVEMDLRRAGADQDVFASAFRDGARAIADARALRRTVDCALRRTRGSVAQSTKEAVKEGVEEKETDEDASDETEVGVNDGSADRRGDDETTSAAKASRSTSGGLLHFNSDPVDALLRGAAASDSSDDDEGEDASDASGRIDVDSETDEASGASSRGGTAYGAAVGVDEAWAKKKRDVHARHSGRGTIQVSMAFEIISTKAKGEAGVEARLAELENTTSGRTAQTHRISQQEYVTRLHRLNDDIANAWLAEDRVNALKLCVKVAKLLVDTKTGKFYPVLFVLVTEVIETVGRLVYDRILRKAEETASGDRKRLPENFKASDLRAVARATCKNWFYKVATIREMIPRMYMELALFKCYRFLQDEPPHAQLERLMKMSRGIGDPMAAAYMRMYIVKTALACGCETRNNSRTLEILRQFMPSYAGVLDDMNEEDPSTAYIFRLGLTRRDYAELMDPAMEWLIECASRSGSASVLQRVLEMGGEAPPVPFLRAIFRALSPKIVHDNAVKLTALVGAGSTAEDSVERLEAMADCYRILGEKFEIKPPQEGDRLGILREVWRVVQNWTDLDSYCRVADQFLLYVLKYLSQAELETLMKDVARHVHTWSLKLKEKEPSRHAELSEKCVRYVEHMLEVVTEYYNDVSALVSLKWYAYLGETLHGSAKVRFSAALLKCVSTGKEITDPLCLHTVLEAARAVHDDIDGMSSDSSRSEAEVLIVNFVDSVSFGTDYEAHLDFLVVARSSFANLGLVQEVLVYQAISLILAVYERVGTHHTKKTKAFVNACTAYCQITIPSIPGVVVRLELFMTTAEAAILHGLVQQVDGLIRSAITDAQESGGESYVGGWNKLAAARAEIEMLEFASRCASLLIVVPGNLEKGAFLVFRGLIKVIEDFEWEADSVNEIKAYIALIPIVAAMAQENLPYKVEGVQSNDVLFANEPTYIEEAAELTHELIQRATDLAGADVAAEVEDEAEEAENKSRALALAHANLALARVISIVCKPSPEMLQLVSGIIDRARSRAPSSEVDSTTGFVERLFAPPKSIDAPDTSTMNSHH